MMLTQKIKSIIEEHVPQAKAFVADPNADGQHFEAIVVSASFEGLPLVRQHQMVMNALKEQFQEAVHALALKTFTPEKWQEAKHQYNPEILE